MERMAVVCPRYYSESFWRDCGESRISSVKMASKPSKTRSAPSVRITGWRRIVCLMGMQRGRGGRAPLIIGHDTLEVRCRFDAPAVLIPKDRFSYILLSWLKHWGAFWIPPGECWDSTSNYGTFPPPPIHDSIIILLFDAVGCSLSYRHRC
jgi:hypothetical protein